MNKQVTALALVLCLLSSTFAALPASSSSSFAELEKIEASAFGKSILSTVEVHLRTGEPVQNLINLLRNMLAQLEEEQKTADAEHTEFQNSCEADISILNQEIAAAEQRKQEASDQLNIDEPRLKLLIAEEARLQQEIKETQEYLQQLHANRAKEKAQFEENIRQINEALVVFAEARKMIERTSDEYASFIQKSGSLEVPKSAQVFAQVSSQLQKVHLKKKGWNSIAQVLAQILSKSERLANQDIVKRVLGLFDQLIANLNEAAVNERHAEEQRIQIYNKQVEETTKKLNDLFAELNRTQYEIHATKTRIEQNKQKLSEAIRTLQTKNDQLAHRTAECRDEQQGYDGSTSTRNDERSIVAQVIEILESRLALLKQYAQRR